MVVKHHENKKNARNQKIKKTRRYGRYREDFSGEVYLGNEIAVVIRLGIAKVSDDAKNDHGNNEQYEKIGYGVSPVWTCKNFEKTAVNININDKGWIIAQVAPKSDCLYRDLMSLKVILISSS